MKSKRKKIIGINAFFVSQPNTGIGQVSVNLLNSFKEESFYQKNKTLIYLQDELNKEKIFSDFQTIIIHSFYQRKDLLQKIWKEKILLPYNFKKIKGDIFLNLYQCPSVFSNAYHLMIVHDIIPHLFSEYLNNWRKKIYWKLTLRAIKRADKIIAVSHSTKKDLIDYLSLSSSQIKVIYPAIHPIFYQEIDSEMKKKVLQKYNLSSGYLYYGGGLEKRKNVKRILEAYQKLKTENVNLPPLVISGKLMPQLAPLITDAENLVKKMSLEKEVRLLDFVPQKDLPVLYSSASLFLFPSLYEGFGLPVLEAQALGTPVITSNLSSLPEVVDKDFLHNQKKETLALKNQIKNNPHQSALLVDPYNSQEITQAIKMILNNPSLQKTLLQRGKENIQRFSWKKTAQAIAQLIEEEAEKDLI